MQDCYIILLYDLMFEKVAKPVKGIKKSKGGRRSETKSLNKGDGSDSSSTELMCKRGVGF